MPSAVDSSVDRNTETVSESATLRGFFALGFVLAFLEAVDRRVAMGPNLRIAAQVTSLTGPSASPI